MRKAILTILVGSLMGLNIHASDSIKATPIFKAEGLGAAIDASPKRIQLKRSYGQFWMILGNNVTIQGSQIFNFGKGDIGTVFFLNKKFKIDSKRKAAVFSAEMRASRHIKKTLGAYTISMRLLDDGIIEIESDYKLDDSSAKPSVNYFTFRIPSFLCKGNTYMLNNQKHAFSKVSKIETNPKRFIFLPKDKDKNSSFGLKFIDVSKLGISKNKIVLYPAESGKLKFLLDFRQITKDSLHNSEETYAGIDFWKNDKILMPQYNKNLNLVQNPSFESGMHYYRYRNHGAPCDPKVKWLYKIVDKESKFGKHSLMMQALPNSIKHVLPIHHFIVPTEANTRYVFSFYAKGNQPSGLSLLLTGRTATVPLWHPALWKKGESGTRKFNITQKWERYSLEIDSKDCALSMGLAAKAIQSIKGGVIYIDGLQLEKEKETPYTEKPVSIQLQSLYEGNFIPEGAAAGLQLRLTTAKPETAGIGIVKIRNFFGNNILEKSFSFKTDKDGTATVKIPEVNENFSTGIFVAEINLKLANGYSWRDVLRFSVMKFLKNQHKNKNIFNHVYNFWGSETGRPDFEKCLKRWQDIGIGSTHWVEDTSKAHMDALKKYGVSPLANIIMGHGFRKGSMSVDGKSMTGLKKMVNPTKAQLKKFEELCAMRVAKSPEIESWYFFSESSSGCLPLASDLDSFAKFLIATYKGVKKGNQNAKVLVTGGPWNISPNSGQKEIESYIKAVTKLAPDIKFDGIGAHIYRKTPENPDLDSEITSLIAMLDRNNYKECPIYIIEGGNYFPMAMPLLGMNPHDGNSSRWIGGAFSYDISEAERITTAYYARTWLVGLKHQNQIKCMAGHQMRTTSMDFDLTPFSIQKVSNTLGNLLGDASFKKDIRFAPGIRCYVFEDEKKQPVAAIWSHIAKVDRGQEKAPMAVFQFGKEVPEIYDLMETQVEITQKKDGKVILPVGSYPMFFVGKPGSLESMCNAISAATLVGQKCVAKISLKAFPVSVSTAKMVYKNLVTQPFCGTATVTYAKDTEEFKVTIPPAESFEYIFKTKTAFKKNRMRTFKVNSILMEKNGEKISNQIRFPVIYVEKSTPTIDGSLADWEGIPFIPLKAKTDQAFNTEIKLAWDSDKLYLLAKVNDSNLEPTSLQQIMKSQAQDKLKIERKNGSEISGDAFSICIDAYCNGRNKIGNGKLDNNDDYCYEFIPQKKLSGKMFAYCKTAPLVQACSGGDRAAPSGGTLDKSISGIVKREKGFTIYEIAIPKERIQPLNLKKGISFGFSARISDGNNEGAPRSAGLPSLDWLNPQKFLVINLVE